MFSCREPKTTRSELTSQLLVFHYFMHSYYELAISQKKSRHKITCKNVIVEFLFYTKNFQHYSTTPNHHLFPFPIDCLAATTVHKLHVLGTNDDLWDRVRGLGSETWKGCEWVELLVVLTRLRGRISVKDGKNVCKRWKDL